MKRAKFSKPRDTGESHWSTYVTTYDDQ